MNNPPFTDDVLQRLYMDRARLYHLLFQPKITEDTLMESINKNVATQIYKIEREIDNYLNKTANKIQK